jgi:hypothetical protein
MVLCGHPVADGPSVASPSGSRRKARSLVYLDALVVENGECLHDHARRAGCTRCGSRNTAATFIATALCMMWQPVDPSGKRAA